MTETITRRQVRHPRDFRDRELFKRAFTHWMPSEKVDALYSELQGDFKKVFKKVCELSIEELKHYGLTQRDAIAFLSMLELFKRSEGEEDKPTCVTGTGYFAQSIQKAYGHKKQEHLVVWYLDVHYNVIEERVVFIGSVHRSMACPREIFHYAVKNLARYVLVAHNHPSGSVYPSSNDINVTEALEDAAKLFEMEVLDHVIVTKDNYYSFRDNGRMRCF